MEKFIAAIVLNEKDLTSQWDAFDSITADVKKERLRFYFTLGDDEQSTIKSHMQNKTFGRVIKGVRKKFGSEAREDEGGTFNSG